MFDPRPIIVVPKSNQVSQMIAAGELGVEPRAQRVGVVVIAPRSMQAADLMVSCVFWPRPLREAGVGRVAVLLGVEAWVRGKPVFGACRCKMRELGIEVEYFHEGHLESDQIQAWFERRRPRRRVTTDTLMKLSHRYAARGHMRAAGDAMRIAEATAMLDESALEAVGVSATAVAKAERSAAVTVV